MSISSRLILAVTVFLLGTGTARAEEIRVLSSVGIKAVVEVLGPQFERATKHKVTTVFDLAGVLKTRIEGGEPFDVAILTHLVRTEISTKKGDETLRERETIVFHRRDGRWIAVHEHLSPQP